MRFPFLMLCGLIAVCCLSTKAAALNLNEALEAAQANNINARIIEEKSRGLSLRQQSIDEGKIKHSLTGRSGFSRNEVGDSQDLTASALASLYYTISYQQQFESGFNWTVSHVLRSGTAISSSAQDENYIKLLLVARYPLMGKSAEINQLRSRKQTLQINADQSELDQSEAKFQIKAARAFFTAHLEDKALEISKNRILLHEERNRILRDNPSRYTEIERSLYEIELEKEQISSKQKEIIRNNAYHQLELLIGKPVTKPLVIPEQIPSRQWTEETVLPLYLRHSPELKRLSNQLELLQQDVAITELDNSFDLSVGGLLGTSSLNGSSGSNFGANVSFTYNFGGGVDKTGSAIRRDIAAIGLEAELEKQNVALQVKNDLSQFNSLIKQLELAKQEYRLVERQIALKETEFEIGTFEREKLIDKELDLQNLLLNIAERDTDVWFQLLTIIENGGFPIDEYLF